MRAWSCHSRMQLPSQVGGKTHLLAKQLPKPSALPCTSRQPGLLRARAGSRMPSIGKGLHCHFYELRLTTDSPLGQYHRGGPWREGESKSLSTSDRCGS